MKGETNCPVCDFHQIERGNNVCPRCRTDLSLWNEVIDLPDKCYNQALQMIKANRVQEAKERLTAALGLYPEHLDSQLLLGKIYAELEMHDEAIAVWEKALKQSPENSSEIEELISEAKYRQVDRVTKNDEEQKRILESVRGEEVRRMRLRWIGYSVLFSITTLIIGIFLPYPFQAPFSTQPVISEPVAYKQAAEEILKTKGVSGIGVNQKNSIVYLLGEVMVPQEKYQLEKFIRGIKGVSAIDLSGIEVLHPKGYYYIVKNDDSLWSIAERIWGDGAKYGRIYQTNKRKIPNSSNISPGITIVIPE